MNILGYSNFGLPVWAAFKELARWTPAHVGSRLVHWSDPSDLRTLFQDSAGTTPVASPGDPVGLMLDTRRGLNRGPEQVSNGTFEGGIEGWGKFLPVAGSDVALSHVDGRLRVTLVSGYDAGVSYPLTGLNIGSAYWVSYEYDISNVSTNRLALLTMDGSYEVPPSAPSVQTVSRIFYADAEADSIEIRTAGSGVQTGDYFEIDNVSVRELPGNHASQPLSDYRPLYQADGMLDDDDQDDSMSVTLPAIAAATVAIARQTGAEITYPVDLSAGSYTLDGDSYGWVIVDGELTAAEQAQLTKWMNAKAGV